MAHLCKYRGETVEQFVHFPKLFQCVELVNAWNNCVAAVELNCGVTVEQNSAKKSFSVSHYGTASSIMWNDYGTAYSTLWNNHLIYQPGIPHHRTFDLRGIIRNSIPSNKIYVVRSGVWQMQLFSHSQ